jgi:hypothetical protein
MSDAGPSLLKSPFRHFSSVSFVFRVGHLIRSLHFDPFFPFNMLITLGRRSSLAVTRQAVRSVSVWSAVPAGPPDPILGMSMTSKDVVWTFDVSLPSS